MPYKIIAISTKPSLSTPNFDEWLLTVPESAIAAFPDAAGKTPVQVIADSVGELGDPAKGFIGSGKPAPGIYPEMIHSPCSARLTPVCVVPESSDLVSTWEVVWTSKVHWLNAASANSFTDQKSEIQSAGGYLRKLYKIEHNITSETFEANI